MLFQENLPKLWLLWELAVLSEPILVYCPGDLAKCTEAVYWLTSLIKPITFGGDFRWAFLCLGACCSITLRFLDRI